MTVTMKKRCKADVSSASESEGEEAREEYELLDVISMRVSYPILYTCAEKSYLASPNITASCCSHQILFTSSLGISRLSSAVRLVSKYGLVDSRGEGVLYTVSNYIQPIVQQNKKEQAKPITWQEEPYDAQLGQSLFYLLALQLRALCFRTHPPPL